MAVYRNSDCPPIGFAGEHSETIWLDEHENIGNVYERAAALLAKIGRHKDANTIKKAHERFARGMKNPSGAHQHGVVLRWLSNYFTRRSR